MTFNNFNHYKDLPVMIHTVDQSGNVIYANNLWLETLGYTAEEVIGKTSTFFLTEKSRKYAIDIVLPIFFKNEKVREIPYEFVSKKGDIIYVQLSANVIKKANGSFSHAIATSSNVTHLINFEENSRCFINNWMPEPEQLSTKLYDLRKSVEFTQDKMAEILKLSIRTYQRLEQGAGRLTLEQVITLSTHFNFPPNLFFMNGDMFRYKRTMKVLVVDDEKDITEVISDQLEQIGCETQVAYNGVEALKRINYEHFDAIITDLSMPIMGGASLIRKVKSLPLRKRPEIFICSAIPTSNLMDELKLNPQNIFPKPLDFESLKLALFSNKTG